ncbi:MAG: AI-2E family transporter [Verrucomicrobiota bacterium]
MNPPVPSRRNAGFKLLLTLACTVVIIAGLRAAQDILIPILLGLFLAILSMPMTAWFRSHRIPGPLAVLMAVAIHVSVLTLLVVVIANIMPDFEKSLSKYDKDFQEIVIERAEAVQTWINNHVAPLQTWFTSKVGSEGEELVGPELPNQVVFDVKSAAEQLVSVNSLKSLFNWINEINIIQKTTSLVTMTFFAFILMVFILGEAGRFADKIEKVVEARGPNFRRFRNAGQEVQRYLGIKTLASIATGLLAWGVCAIFGVQFAVLWGLVAFLFNYVPTIGSLVAAIPPVLVALIQPGGGGLPSMGVAICYLAINVGIGNFIEPTLLGHRFGISTVVVVLSVLFWGWVWGPVGMFLAVPLTMMMKMTLDESDDFKWISVLMSKNKEEELEALIEEQESAAQLPPGAEPEEA